MQSRNRNTSQRTTHPATRHQGWRDAIGFAVASMLLVFAYAQSALAADASPVVTRLQTVSGIVKNLTDSLGGDGKFSDLKNALSIPFLGGAPASLDDQMFDQLLGTTGLGRLNAITANTD